MVHHHELPYTIHTIHNMNTQHECTLQGCSFFSDNAAGTIEHICFIGSGNLHEDQYLHMIIANVLRRNAKYISICTGGYKGLSTHIIDSFYFNYIYIYKQILHIK